MYVTLKVAKYIFEKKKNILNIILNQFETTLLNLTKIRLILRLATLHLALLTIQQTILTISENLQ